MSTRGPILFQGVHTGSGPKRVGARSADEPVVPMSTDDDVVPVAANQDVVLDPISATISAPSDSIAGTMFPA